METVPDVRDSTASHGLLPLASEHRATPLTKQLQTRKQLSNLGWLRFNGSRSRRSPSRGRWLPEPPEKHSQGLWGPDTGWLGEGEDKLGPLRNLCLPSSKVRWRHWKTDDVNRWIQHGSIQPILLNTYHISGTVIGDGASPHWAYSCGGGTPKASAYTH